MKKVIFISLKSKDMSKIEFVKKTHSSHKNWVKSDKKKEKIINTGDNFDDIPIYTMTKIVVTNWSVDIEKLFNQIPITKYLSDGIVLSHNPFWAEVLNGKLKLYFMPERNGHADLHTFDIELVN